MFLSLPLMCSLYAAAGWLIVAGCGLHTVVEEDFMVGTVDCGVIFKMLSGIALTNISVLFIVLIRCWAL